MNPENQTMKSLSILLFATLVAAGCNQSDTADRAKELTSKAGHALGEGAGTFFSGIGAGYEKAVTAYDVRVAPELIAKGVTVSVAKHGEGTNAAQTTLSLYIINKHPVTGTLRIKLFSAATQEVGRATATVTLPTDDARYVPFHLSKEIPLVMTRFIELDLKKEP